MSARMGDGADARMEWELERAERLPTPRDVRTQLTVESLRSAVARLQPDPLESTTHWTTKEGITMTLSEMSARHRGNTVRMLQRNAREVFRRRLLVLQAQAIDAALHHDKVVRPGYDEELNTVDAMDPLEYVNSRPVVLAMLELGIE